MRTLCDVLKENSDDFIALNVNVFDFVFHLSPKMLPYCSYMVAKWHLPSPAFYYIKCNIFYLQYELYGDNCFGLAVNGIDTVTFDLSVYSCYFELVKQTDTQSNTLLKDVVTAEHLVSNTMFIIFRFLIDSTFCY